MKRARQEAILKIINNKPVSTQQQLSDELENLGFITAQATLSRDIKDLQLVKKNGTYFHRRLDLDEGNHDKLIQIFKQSVKSVHRAQNIIVIKTLPGFANSACIAIDSMSVSGLVGTIAGDDTAFLAMSDNNAAEVFIEDILENLQL